MAGRTCQNNRRRSRPSPRRFARREDRARMAAAWHLAALIGWAMVAQSLIADPAADESVVFTPPGFQVVGRPAAVKDRPSGRVRVAVRDPATGRPVPCRINVVGSDGQYYEPDAHDLKPYSLTGEWPEGGAMGNRVGKAPIRYFGRFFYCLGDATVAVPPGPVRVEVWRGIEHAPRVATATVAADREESIEIGLPRTVAMAEHGYFGGDPHLHLDRVTAEDERRIFDLLEAEDIRYGVLMAYNEPAGPYAGSMDRLASPQRRGLGRRSIASRGDHAIISGQEYRSNTYGHLNLFLLDGLVEAGRSLDADEWPLYGDVARRAREAGGISVYAHGGYAQAIYADVVQGNVDAVELLQFGVYRGIGLDDWYHLLNCGFHFPLVGASDYPACRILGDARTYVQLDADRSLTAWLEAAKAGRSFATTGPLLLLEVDGHRPGAVLDRAAVASRRATVRIRVRSEVSPVSDVQLVVNGRVVRAEEVPAERQRGEWLDWEWPIDLPGSSWIAARAFSTAASGAADAESHTNPVYVNYGGRAAYDRDSLDIVLGRIDRQTAVHQARTFARKADVLTSFARSRDILLAIREAGGAPAAGHPADIAPAIDLGKREHSDAELAEFLKPVPPKPIAEVLRTFDTVGGFEMQLVAQEPLVVDPVAAAFDADGRLYVCELRDYPYKPREGQAALGTVRQLRDTDGDGAFDESSVFADGLLWAAGVVPWRGGVYVAASPDIWYLKDTDGDGVADVRRRVFSGFGTQNQQAMVNNLQLGLDHWIYGSAGANGGTVHRVDRGHGKPTVVNGRDFRFHPDTLDFEPVTGTLQFGNSFDDWGHRFLCSESQPLLHEVLPQHYLARNPHLPAPHAIHNAAPPPVPVFRSSPVERWRAIRSSRRVLHTDRSAAGAGVSHNVIDGAAGVTVYRGAAYPAEYHGSIFVGDAQNNLVHRRTVTPRGVTFDSRRADEGAEFVRSSDNWFRPVNFVNAPDGTLYVLDLSREIIEAIHIPLDVAKHLDLKNGRQLGRIYRMAPPGFRYPGRPRLGDATTPQLLAALESPHGWHRDTAQRLLFERQDRAAIDPLRKLLRTAADARPRLHALHALAGLDALGDGDLLAALADPSPHLRIHALRLAEPRLDRAVALRDRLRQLARDPDPEVRFQTAFSLGASRSADLVPALAAVAAASAGDAWMRAAVLSSATHCAGDLLDELLRDAVFAASEPGRELLEQLVLIAGSRGERAEVERVLMTLAARAPAAVQPTLVGGLGAGLGRHGDRLPSPASLPPPARALLERLIDEARREVVDAAADVAARCAAARLLGCMPLAIARKQLFAGLDPRQPEQLQTTAIQALATYPDDDVTAVLLDRLRSFPPGPQKQALDVLLAREGRARRLLEAARAGTVSLVALDASQRAQLAQHPQESLRRLAAEVFGTAAGGDRAAVVRRYEPALDLAGDAARGQEVFRRNCAVCHKIGAMGDAVGPDLTSAAARDPKAMLTHILDPSQYVPPNYLQYVVEDVNGRLHTGLLTAQTATSVTVTRAEGHSETLLRSDIESLTSTAKSMMPEGFEEKISPAEMADLLAFLRSTRAAGDPGPGALDIGTMPGLVEPE